MIWRGKAWMSSGKGTGQGRMQNRYGCEYLELQLITVNRVSSSDERLKITGKSCVTHRESTVTVTLTCNGTYVSIPYSQALCTTQPLPKLAMIPIATSKVEWCHRFSSKSLYVPMIMTRSQPGNNFAFSSAFMNSCLILRSWKFTITFVDCLNGDHASSVSPCRWTSAIASHFKSAQGKSHAWNEASVISFRVNHHLCFQGVLVWQVSAPYKAFVAFVDAKDLFSSGR